MPPLVRVSSIVFNFEENSSHIKLIDMANPIPYLSVGADRNVRAGTPASARAVTLRALARGGLSCDRIYRRLIVAALAA